MPDSWLRLVLVSVLPLATVGACGPDADDSSTAGGTSATVSASGDDTAESGSEGDSETGTETGGGVTCESVCPSVLEAACSGGPVDMADCASGCAYSGMTCPAEWSAVLACLSPGGAFMCDASGRVTAAGCATEYEALYSCLGVP